MKKQLNVEIGGRIRKCRETLGYSRETLAEKAELANSFIGTIELGSGSFTAESLIKLCRALGTSAVSYRITCNNGNQRTLINP